MERHLSQYDFFLPIRWTSIQQTLVDKVENSNKYQNVDERVLTETWQKPGDVVRYKANVTDRLTQYYTYASSRFVQDLDILQLSSLSLQYGLPKRWIAPLCMESMRISFNTSDLLYLSTVKRERGTSHIHTPVHSPSDSVTLIFNTALRL